MLDHRILTLAIAIIVPLSPLLYSNSRISEAKETLRAEISELRAELRLELSERFNAMEQRFNSIDRK